MRRKIKYYIHGFKNMWRWRKVLFRDQDWDYWYIYNVLKTKLEFTADHIEKYGIHENKAIDVAQIREVVKLIDIVQNETIINEAIQAPKWTREKYNEVQKRHDATKAELFKKLHDNIDNWWD